MIIPSPFQITVTKWGQEKRYRMKVEIIHHSDQLMKFKIYAGERFITMEKHLLLKNQWKLGQTNASLQGNHQEIAGAVLNIQNEIDGYLKNLLENKK
jgi:hypothetical protein